MEQRPEPPPALERARPVPRVQLSPLRETLATRVVSNDRWSSPTHSRPMPDYGDLTDLQLMIMSVLWSQREATIGTIHERLATQEPVARKTIAMILSRLE